MRFAVLIFGKFAKFPHGNTAYPALTAAGVIPMQYFASALTSSSTSLVSNLPLVTKVYFPRILLPLAAVAVFEENALEKLPNFLKHVREFLARHPELSANVHMPRTPGVAGRRMLSTVNESKLRRILARIASSSDCRSGGISTRTDRPTSSDAL